MSNIRILLAEDHELVRSGLKLLINAEADLEVIAEAADGATALRLIRDVQPDVAVIDLGLPHMTGIELAAKVQQTRNLTRLLALTANEDPAYIKLLLQLGATGYLLKRSAAEELILAIRTVASGERYLAANLVDLFIDRPTLLPAGSDVKPASMLSDREEDVLRKIAEGLTNKEIAHKLDISIKTIETYKSRAMQKLELRGRADIVRYAVNMGWLREK